MENDSKQTRDEKNNTYSAADVVGPVKQKDADNTFTRL